jgi:hypothetical protein
MLKSKELDEAIRLKKEISELKDKGHIFGNPIDGINWPKDVLEKIENMFPTIDFGRLEEPLTEQLINDICPAFEHYFSERIAQLKGRLTELGVDPDD